METYIIPKFKKDFKDNKFLSHYSFKTGKGFNMRRTIKYYFNESNYELLLEIESDLEKISKNIDNKFSLPIKSNKTGDSVISSYSFIDLLSIYDKMTNLGRYGGTRSSLFLSNSKSKDSAYAQFLLHQAKIEHGVNDEGKNIFIENLLNNITVNNDSEEKINKKLYRESLYLSLFGSLKKGVKSYMIAGEDGSLEKFIGNQYFTLIESIETSLGRSKEQVEKDKLIKTTMEYIKTLGILSTNCT